MVNKRSGWDLPTILNLNVRSLSEEKLDELQVNVTIHDVSIICVTETWFIFSMDDKNLSIKGTASGTSLFGVAFQLRR